MSPDKQNGSNGAGHNGKGRGSEERRGEPDNPIEDFDALIRDRDDDFDLAWDAPTGARSRPRGDYDPYADFQSAFAGSGYGTGGGFADRGLADSITRLIEAVAGIAGDAIAPEVRRQIEKALRDLLAMIRDVISSIIERIDERASDDFEIEEIPID